MSWTRLDDGWTDRQEFEDLPYDVRWHYLALIQFCSRNARYDGVMRAVDARRCSDLEDPMTAIAILAGAGLLEIEDNTVRVVRIDDHIPPPHMRDENRKYAQKERKRRERAHRSGDHSMCLPEHCLKAPVTSEVTRDVGTGQDGPGQGNYPTRDNAENVRDLWAVTAAGYDD